MRIKIKNGTLPAVAVEPAEASAALPASAPAVPAEPTGNEAYVAAYRAFIQSQHLTPRFHVQFFFAAMAAEAHPGASKAEIERWRVELAAALYERPKAKKAKSRPASRSEAP